MLCAFLLRAATEHTGSRSHKSFVEPRTRHFTWRLWRAGVTLSRISSISLPTCSLLRTPTRILIWKIMTANH